MDRQAVNGADRPGNGFTFGWIGALAIALVLVGCSGGANDTGASADSPSQTPSIGAPGNEPDPISAGSAGEPETTPAFTYAGPVLEDLPLGPDIDELVQESERDWAIAGGTLRWAWDQQLEILPIGEVMAILGTTFVGTPYAPGTLELPGDERLVVNLRTFDCVTLVEHVLVLARLVVSEDAELLADEEAFRARYRDELTRVRYRDGVLSGYPSRLHYFSEWISNGETKGLVEDVTGRIGGVVDSRPVHFMSSNPDAYRQLGEDPEALASVRSHEAGLNESPRFYIPQSQIAERTDLIQNGDVIAAVSTVDGLDVAHTGIAIWHDGRLHLMHAPLVGDSVEISERPLAERIQDISGQQGIIVARPLAP